VCSRGGIESGGGEYRKKGTGELLNLSAERRKSVEIRASSVSGVVTLAVSSRRKREASLGFQRFNNVQERSPKNKTSTFRGDCQGKTEETTL